METHSILREGSAEILFSKGKEVFYNPVQEVNRDLSIAMIKLFQQKYTKNTGGLRILEALAATGLRSIRYMKEIPGIDTIVANDLDPAAVEAIKKNVEYNKLDPTKVVPNLGDAA